MKDEDIQLNTKLELLFKTSLGVFAAIFLSKLFSYIYKIVIARYFGIEVYGLYSLALIIAGFFVAFTSLGLSDGVIRYISFYRGKEDSQRIRHVLKVALSLSVLASTLGGILLFALAEVIAVSIFHNEQLTVFLKVFSVTVPLAVLSNVMLGVLKSYERVTTSFLLLNVVQNGLRLLALVLLIFIGVGSDSVMTSYLIAALGLALGAYLASRAIIKQVLSATDLAAKEKRKLTNDLLTYSWPIMFLGAIYGIFYWTDSFMIGYLNNVADVGLYSAALTLLTLFGIAPDLFVHMFFPIIVKEFSKNNLKLINELSKQVSKWIFMLNLPLFLFIFIFPDAVINLFYGEKFLAASTPLRILIIGSLLASFTSLFSNLITMKGKSRLLLTNFIIFSLLNVVLNAILIPRYGLNGAAIATVISWALLSLVLLVQVRINVSVFPFRRKMVRIVLASLIPLIMLIILDRSMQLTNTMTVIVSISFALVYFSTLYLTGCFDRNDERILGSIRNLLSKKPSQKTSLK